MSTRDTRSVKICLPASLFMLTVMLRLLQLSIVKYRLSTPGTSRSWLRVMSPVLGASSLMTSAPSHASSCVADGPDCTCVMSSTRTPDNAFPPTFFGTAGSSFTGRVSAMSIPLLAKKRSGPGTTPSDRGNPDAIPRLHTVCVHRKCVPRNTGLSRVRRDLCDGQFRGRSDASAQRIHRLPTATPSASIQPSWFPPQGRIFFIHSIFQGLHLLRSQAFGRASSRRSGTSSGFTARFDLAHRFVCRIPCDVIVVTCCPTDRLVTRHESVCNIQNPQVRPLPADP